MQSLSEQIQEIVLEMANIISDTTSTDDERDLALDTMIQALFPGTTADVLEGYGIEICRSARR